MGDYLSSINKLYSENLEIYGINSKSVGWKDSESQNLRFSILNEVIEENEQSISVNDYGCGYGAHLSNLLESGWRVSSYNAYDINLNMLAKLADIYKNLENCTITYFASSQITTLADYSLASGTFNVLPDGNIPKWEENIKNAIIQMKKFSRKGLAFNLLSTYVDWRADGLYYGDPLVWFDFCKREISKNVTLFHNYNLFEWTIICRLTEEK